LCILSLEGDGAGAVFFVLDVASAESAGSDIIIKLIDSIPEIDANSQGKKSVDIIKLKGHIRLENIDFHYLARSAVRVLRGISLDIQPGTYIALVGASGCGKSMMYVTHYHLYSSAKLF
jgi:ATP-binding cassette subfamily B (MDR/TAP) protein 1